MNVPDEEPELPTLSEAVALYECEPYEAVNVCAHEALEQLLAVVPSTIMFMPVMPLRVSEAVAVIVADVPGLMLAGDTLALIEGPVLSDERVALSTDDLAPELSSMKQ